MKLLVACDIDGTLIDTSASFTRIVLELSGANLTDVQRFRDRGGFNDDWELTRALTAWLRAGQPHIVDEVFDWRDVIARVGHDPGDMSAECMRLYRGGYWRHERALVDAALLTEVHARHRIAACTGRDAWEMEKAEALLGFRFEHATTMEHVRKPDPNALLRLVRDEDTVVLLGDTGADRLTAENARALGPSPRVHFYRATVGDAARTAAFLRELATCARDDDDVLTSLLAARCS